MNEHQGGTRQELSGYQAAVRLGAIKVDNSYQPKEEDRGGIRQIVDHFDERALGVPVVSKRDDGFYYVVDGQRRTAAMRQLFGVEHCITVQVWEGLSREEEAHLFGLLNTRKELNSLQKFRARLFSGDEVAASIQRIVRKHGLDIALRQGGQAGNRVTAVVALQNVYDRFGAESLDETIRILRAADDGSPQMYVGSAIVGLAMFLGRFPEASRDRVVRCIQEAGGVGMMTNAARIREVLGEHGNGLWGRALHSRYNKGLRSGKLGPWPDRDYSQMARGKAVSS
ncbi:MAG: DUF6551 family protein [Dehalococcoidia bacterium]